MNKLYLSIGVALLLIGCGSNSNNNENSASGEKQEKVSIPKNIDMDFPKALQNGKNRKSIQKQAHFNKEINSSEESEVFLNKSRGYRQLKDNIAEVEESKKELEINLLLADKLMPTIQEKCEDIPLETTCTIESGELSFTLDKPFMREIITILEEDDDLSDFEKIEVKLGKTTFTQYGDLKDFQYALILDMTPLVAINDTSLIHAIQTIKWSKDENYISSIYDEKGDSYDSVLSINYMKKDNGETEMNVDDSYKDMGTSSSATSSRVEVSPNGEEERVDMGSELFEGEFHLKLTNLNGEYKISSNSIDKFNSEEMSYTSIGEIGKKGGYLKFRGVFDNTEYREKDIFDANGDSLSSTYCDESQECSLDDESTWLKSENYDEVANTTPLDMVELSVTGGNLQEDKQYILLPPKSTIDGKRAKEIFNITIGDIYVDSEHTSNAILYDNSYLDRLDSLVVVEVEMKESSEETAPKIEDLTFKVLSDEDRPTFSKE